MDGICDLQKGIDGGGRGGGAVPRGTAAEPEVEAEAEPEPERRGTARRKRFLDVLDGETEE